ncbi:MAG: pentapeptide repeat-containing protein [Thalassospira sp.]|uniref:pentapeptide repeat-containing protein n=1 Tax=Thalassospira sp. TaxID=1912094 RepID=UPI001B11CB81|nr:pentapeptide repeat-containing protein [Thalassospira sp.]MBO6581126.1 pentapeptide repeat-containing protein [Thalassospira sp.]MBO6819732.1 pentapeptide repeat-containing protein [Thalassospira sp.]MBO6886572.1 pentapeptide repeat-containing protein [Thalassospira sp.]
MKTRPEDPIELGNRGRWPDLIALGVEAWNEWARAVKPAPEQEFIIRIGTDRLNNIDFTGFVFPNNTIFESRNNNSQVNCANTTFLGRFTFKPPVAANKVNFEGACFVGDTDFSNTMFARAVNFSNVHFGANANFAETEFDVLANFEGSVFDGELKFSDARFKLPTNFDGCVFKDDVTFERSVFQSLPLFSNTTFSSSIPNLRAAHFAPHYPPDFHSAKLSYPTKSTQSLWDRVRKICDTPDGAERARILKKLAADGHNHDEELRFFTMEMRAKRKHEIPYNNVLNWPKLIINHAYEFFSDFGQSILRPTCWLVGIFTSSAYFYAGLLYETPISRLTAIWERDPSILTASFSSLLPFAGQTLIGRKVIESGLCGRYAPSSIEHIDCLSTIYRISAIEGILAFIFLFLLGVALRNIARIK